MVLLTDMNRTERALANLNDEGLFEKIATAVLREAEPRYRGLVHPGVNSDGRTVKSPVDGITFLLGTSEPHAVYVHHTITAQYGLERKWLLDPTQVKTRTGRKSTASPGDLIKTGEVLAEHRKKINPLPATLILTTCHEPDADLVCTLKAEALKLDLEIDLWSGSRLAQFLDSKPAGQWIRRKYLQIEAELISMPLLAELSRKSIESYAPRDESRAWVERVLDRNLAAAAKQPTTFLVASSGLGKSVACHKWLATHVAGGGVGLVLSHDIIEKSLTVVDAVDAALRELDSSIAQDAGASAMDLCTPEKPLRLIVEDINLSGRAALLAEKIENWVRVGAADGAKQRQSYRLVCPLWPEILGSLRSQARKAIEPLCLFGSTFTSTEGRRSVQLRAIEVGASVSDLAADAVSTALGHDPLLIALHDPSKSVMPEAVIGNFVENAIGHAARTNQIAAADYRLTLRAFAGRALQNRSLNPLWTDVRSWIGISGDDVSRLGHLTHAGDLLHLSGPSAEQKVGFRHDRVRDWLLVDAADRLAGAGILSLTVTEDPYFAETLGALLARRNLDEAFLARLQRENPLALFFAIRCLPEAGSSWRRSIVGAIGDWLTSDAARAPSNEYLCWEAVSSLAQTDGPEIPALVRRFNLQGTSPWQALARNGDLSGAVLLCASVEPGTGAPWRDVQIDHIKHKFGRALVKKVDELLRGDDRGGGWLVGVLRLAGHVADHSLADGIRLVWEADGSRFNRLADYLWAFAQCCGNEAERYLSAVCDECASNLKLGDWTTHARFAFRRWPPIDALEYFVRRAEEAGDDFLWSILYMLSEVDHPITVQFAVRTIAASDRKLAGTGKFLPGAMILSDSWKWLQRDGGDGMSAASRDPLLALWIDAANDEYDRRAAFKFWVATESEADIAILQDQPDTGCLADVTLIARLNRGDQTATPRLLKKIAEDDGARWWWHFVRYVWSDDLLGVLDEELAQRGEELTSEDPATLDIDIQLSDLLMRAGAEVGGPLLIKYWDNLKKLGIYVQTALYLTTPLLLEKAEAAIAGAANPKELLKHIRLHLGINLEGHPGITHEGQILALVPYLSYLGEHEVKALRDICNRRGWFSLRLTHIDPYLRILKGLLYEDDDATYADLDRMVEQGRFHFLDHWLERYAETGATKDMIVARFEAWFAGRRSPGALHLMCDMLVQVGDRSDLSILNRDSEPVDSASNSLRMNTIYAVRRRSLH